MKNDRSLNFVTQLLRLNMNYAQLKLHKTSTAIQSITVHSLVMNTHYIYLYFRINMINYMNFVLVVGPRRIAKRRLDSWEKEQLMAVAGSRNDLYHSKAAQNYQNAPFIVHFFIIDQ